MTNESTIRVIETFRSQRLIDRWPLPSLKDDDVRRCLGRLPEGLSDANDALLGHVAERFGIVIELDAFDDVLIGRERT